MKKMCYLEKIEFLKKNGFLEFLCIPVTSSVIGLETVLVASVLMVIPKENIPLAG